MEGEDVNDEALNAEVVVGVVLEEPQEDGNSPDGLPFSIHLRHV